MPWCGGSRPCRSKHGKSFPDAVRAVVASVLVSPAFLFLEEPTGTDSKPRELNDHELANRLSYFLWSTLPDAELTQLAAQKQLREPGVLRAQVKRMLADPRARQFVENFVGQWMRVREFDSVMVDTRQYKDYDDALRDASLREPYEFFHELLRADLPVLNLLDSDFLVINERLAKHYGIDGVKGEQFRRVPLRAGAPPRRHPRHGRAVDLPGGRDADAAGPARRLRSRRALEHARRPAAAQRRRSAGHQGQEPDRAAAARTASVGRLLCQLPHQDRPARPGAGKLRRHRRLARTPERRGPQGRQERPADRRVRRHAGRPVVQDPARVQAASCWKRRRNSSRASRRNCWPTRSAGRSARRTRSW